jgi:hypothetical protein
MHDAKILKQQKISKAKRKSERTKTAMPRSGNSRGRIAIIQW